MPKSREFSIKCIEGTLPEVTEYISGTIYEIPKDHIRVIEKSTADKLAKQLEILIYKDDDLTGGQWKRAIEVLREYRAEQGSED